MWLKNLFKKLFSVYEPIYDESSDCFDAMKFALKQYEEEYSWLDEQRKTTFNQIKNKEVIQEEEPGASTRYSLQYLYKHGK